MRAFITGCEGTRLSASERSFLREAQPCGLILFQRNADTREQVRALIAEFREAVGRADVFVSVDQEGGRVQRLAPPNWRQLPAAERYRQLFAKSPDVAVEAARVVARLMADDLAVDGFNMNCVPVLDVPTPGAHQIIGSRAYGDEPDAVVKLASAVAIGHLAGGVLPVAKHVPGHGRATVDSHHELPRVDTDLETLAASDFAPFRALANLPTAMTAHVVYTAIDPDAPATTSATVIETIIRGVIGFDGLLMSDDLSMRALNGSLGDRTAAALSAGCDVALHCNGRLDEMEAVAGNAPELADDAARRFAHAMRLTERKTAFDQNRALEVLELVLRGTDPEGRLVAPDADG